jgi:MFS transporter, AAHS family, 4-hydroxybenzoate transporter
VNGADASSSAASGADYWTAKAALAVGLCFLINMVDGMDINILTFVAPALQKDWGISSGVMGYIFSAGLAGMAIGGMGIAPLADRYGRRKIILAALALMSLGMVACGYVTSVGALIAARVVVGAGIGTVLASMAALAAEAAPPSKQSFAVGAVQAGFPFAAVFTGFIVASVLPEWGWQKLLLAAGVLTVLMLPLAWAILPESAAHASVKQGAVKQGAVKQDKVPLAKLFGSDLRRGTILLWLSTFFGLMVLYFITSWITKLSIQAGLSETNGIYAGATYNIGAFTGTMLMSWLSMRFRLMRIVPAFLLCAGLAMTIFANVAFPVGITLSLAFLIGVSLQGGYNGVWPLAASVYPVECRATGVGWAIGIGRGGAVIGPLMGGYLLAASAPLWLLFAVYCVPLAICAASVWLQASAKPPA